MTEWTFYVGASYGISASILLAMLLFAWRRLAAQKKQARHLETLAREKKKKQEKQEKRQSERGLQSLPLAAALLALSALALALWGSLSEKPAPFSQNRLAAGRLAAAPALSLPAIDGISTPGFSDSDLLGQRALLNVWASWCAPCRAEHPLLMRLSRRRDLKLFGIAYKDAPEDSRRFLNRYGNPFWRLGQDQHGEAILALGVSGVPETLLLDEAGRILLHHRGPLTEAVVRDAVLPLLSR